VITAHAKINLGLRVLRRRDDGYHDIATVFHRISLHDDVTLDSSPDIRLVAEAGDLPTDERNLCVKAAMLLREELKGTPGARITLVKRIPVGAGLGGGSSDAAAVLTGLPRLWNRAVEPSTLDSLAFRIGSDVPYFLKPGSALAHGRGEILEYFDLDIPFAILLCNPGIHVSTAWAYGRVAPRSDDSREDLRAIIQKGLTDPEYLRRHLRNDFEEPVTAAYPEIARVKLAMIEAGALYASMSGSGSSVYGFFESARIAEETGRQLSAGGALVSVSPPHFRA